MASAAAKEEEEDHLCCPVCSEVFSQPKILTCGHLICRRCLISWIKTQPEASCPLCRCIIVDPANRASGKSLEDIADSFLSDLVMETWVESHQLLNEDHKCQACLTQTATAICTTCRDLLCASCTTIHKRMTVSRHHTVEELSALTPEKLASSRPSFCSTHRDKVSEVFCPTHGASVCLLCATTDHRQCPDMSQLETKMEEARAVLKDMRAKLQNEEDHLDQAIQQLDQHLQDIQERVKVTAAEIEAMCERLDSSIKQCRKRLNDLLLDACSDVKEAVNEAKTCLLQRRGRLIVHDKVIERAEGGNTPDAVHGMASSLKTRVNHLECSSTLPAESKTISTFTLVIDREAVARVERELSQLGQLKVAPADVLAQPVKPAALTFYDKNKGDRIVLSNNQQTAQKTTGEWGKGIVLSCEPMEVSCLYQVKVDKTASQWNSSGTYLGVATQTPGTVTLPDWSGHLTSGVVVHLDWVRVNGTQTSSEVGSSLREVREGGIVGLMLDKTRTLHLYRDGQPVGVLAPDLPDPCFFMVDLCAYWEKVTALPVQRVK